MINIPTNLDDSYQVRAFALTQAVRCVTDLAQPIDVNRWFERPDADTVVKRAAVFEEYIRNGAPKEQE